MNFPADTLPDRVVDPTPAAPVLAHERWPDLPWALLTTLVNQHGALLSIKELPSGRYVHVNEAMATFLRKAAADVVGLTDHDLFDAATVTALRAAEHTAAAQVEPLSSEHHLERAGTRHSWQVLRVTGSGAQGRWLASVWTDAAPEQQRAELLRKALAQIDEQQRANELLKRELADQALRDPASGLYRRAHFEDQLRREVDLSTREHREFAIVFIEIDALAPQAQALGAAGQQRVLEAVGRLLRGGTRAMDASCRFDEQRFAVLLSGVGLATAHSRMEGLRRKCAAQIVVHQGQELAFSVSVGVASFPHTANTQDTLTEACESALAEAQRRGGNHVTLAAIRFAPAV
jgi:diguanylate cyclase (GGDEF)-like protein